MAKTVMIIDDSVSVRQVVAMTLRGAGYEVLEAVDGKDALAKLTGQKINLFISDVNMPNLDGIGLIRALKGLADYKFTPIVMLTTEGAEAKKQEGQQAGAKAWMVKPFQPAQLLKVVSMLVG